MIKVVVVGFYCKKRGLISIIWIYILVGEKYIWIIDNFKILMSLWVMGISKRRVILRIIKWLIVSGWGFRKSRG